MYKSFLKNIEYLILFIITMTLIFFIEYFDSQISHVFFMYKSNFMVVKSKYNNNDEKIN